MGKSHSRIKWLDIAKGLAVIAVIIDHYNIFSPAIHPYTVFSVSLFFLVGGFNFFNTCVRYNESSLLFCMKRTLPFVWYYILATLIYSLFQARGFNLLFFLQETLLFSASPPFYFCFIFLQLACISGLLFRIIILPPPPRVYLPPPMKM